MNNKADPNVILVAVIQTMPETYVGVCARARVKVDIKDKAGRQRDSSVANTQ